MNEFLQKLLEIIKFEGNKAEFINKFVGNIYKESLINFLSILSKEDGQKVLDEIELAGEDTDKLFSIITTTLSQEEALKIVNETSQKQLNAFLEKITPALTDSQNQELATLIKNT